MGITDQQIVNEVTKKLINHIPNIEEQIEALDNFWDKKADYLISAMAEKLRFQIVIQPRVGEGKDIWGDCLIAFQYAGPFPGNFTKPSSWSDWGSRDFYKKWANSPSERMKYFKEGLLSLAKEYDKLQ